MIEILSSISLKIQYMPQIPYTKEIMSFTSVPYSPNPINGGGTLSVDFKDMNTRIIRVGRG